MSSQRGPIAENTRGSLSEGQSWVSDMSQSRNTGPSRRLSAYRWRTSLILLGCQRCMAKYEGSKIRVQYMMMPRPSSWKGAPKKNLLKKLRHLNRPFPNPSGFSTNSQRSYAFASQASQFVCTNAPDEPHCSGYRHLFSKAMFKQYSAFETMRDGAGETAEGNMSTCKVSKPGFPSWIWKCYTGRRFECRCSWHLARVLSLLEDGEKKRG